MWVCVYNVYTHTISIHILIYMHHLDILWLLEEEARLELHIPNLLETFVGL